MKYFVRTIIQIIFFVLLSIKIFIIVGLFLQKITLNKANLILLTLLFILIVLYVYLYPVKRYEYGIKLLSDLNNRVVKFARKKLIILLDVLILILLWLSNLFVEFQGYFINCFEFVL